MIIPSQLTSISFSEEEAVDRAIDRWNGQPIPGRDVPWNLVVQYPRFSPKSSQYNPQHIQQEPKSGNQKPSSGDQDQRWENRGQYSRENSNASQKQHMATSNRYHNTEYSPHELGPAQSEALSPGPNPYASPQAHNFAAPRGPFSYQVPEAHFKENSPLLPHATLPQVAAHQRRLGPSPVQLEKEMYERQRLEQSQGLHGFGNDSAHGPVAFADENLRPGFDSR